MSAAASVGSGAGNKAVKAISIGTAGRVKTITKGWLGTAGGNKQVFALAAPAGPVQLMPGGNAYDYTNISFGMNNGGYVTISGALQYYWLLSGAASAYQVKVDFTGGNTLAAASAATGTWLGLSGTRIWSLNGAAKACGLNVSIRRASDSVVLATTSIGLNTLVPEEEP